MQVRRILLQTDQLSPNALPHNLPALHYRSLFSSSPTASQIEAHVTKLGWRPAWRYGMYKQAHYHSTTHELLAVFRGSADILLGGSDEVAASFAASGGKVQDEDGEAHAVIKLATGDALLLPAGYAHRALNDRDGFQMVGSYPDGAAQWDMCYPDKAKVERASEAIEKLVQGQRKGLFRAQNPGSGLVAEAEDAIQKYWLDA